MKVEKSRSALKKEYKKFWQKTFFQDNTKYGKQYLRKVGKVGASEEEIFASKINWYIFNLRFHSSLIVILRIPVKLWLENKVKIDQRDRLLTMLESSDEDSQALAFSIMIKLAGKYKGKDRV